MLRRRLVYMLRDSLISTPYLEKGRIFCPITR